MRARMFSPVRLNPMSHIASPVCLDQLRPITLCNWFCGSGIAGVTSQDFNNPYCCSDSLNVQCEHELIVDGQFLVEKVSKRWL